MPLFYPPTTATSDGVTLRLRLMACAVLANLSIHPTLTRLRRERDLGLEQLLHGFGGGLRDKLIGNECCAFSNCLDDGFIESRVRVRVTGRIRIDDVF